MKPPLFISESGDVSAYSTAEAAGSSVEAIDVKDNRYVAYDSEGRLLSLKIVPKKSKFLFLFEFSIEFVVIEPAEEKPGHAKELQKVLTDFLIRIGSPKEWLEKASFEEIVQIAAEKAK